MPTVWHLFYIDSWSVYIFISAANAHTYTACLSNMYIFDRLCPHNKNSLHVTDFAHQRHSALLLIQPGRIVRVYLSMLSYLEVVDLRVYH